MVTGIILGNDDGSASVGRAAATKALNVVIDFCGADGRESHALCFPKWSAPRALARSMGEPFPYTPFFTTDHSKGMDKKCMVPLTGIEPVRESPPEGF
jgi:hypothetical protein